MIILRQSEISVSNVLDHVKGEVKAVEMCSVINREERTFVTRA